MLQESVGRVTFQFEARDVNLVLGPAAGSGPIPFRVFLDGQAVDRAAGTDVAADGRGTLDEQRTYQLVRQPGPITTCSRRSSGPAERPSSVRSVAG